MFGNLIRKTEKKFNIRGAVASLVQNFYTQRQQEGLIDTLWSDWQERARETKLSTKRREEDLVQTFTKDIQKSYSQLTPGTVVIFNYTSLKGVSKAYIAVVVGAHGGNGVYNNTNNRTQRTNTLMSCFLINEGTNLNTLATVVNVLLQKEIDKTYKTYKPLTNNNKQDDFVQQQARQVNPRISEDGVKTLFPTTEFRTFLLNMGMKTMYKVSIND